MKSLITLLFLCTYGKLSAQCPATYTYNANSGGTVTTAYNLTGSKSLHISNNTTYTGSITTDATSIICIDAGSTFNPSGYYTGSGYYNNSGTITFTNLNGTGGNLQWVNTGTITCSNGIYAGNTVTITNSSAGTINLNGLQTGTAASVTNAGTISNTGYSSFASGSVFSNSGSYTSSANVDMTNITLTNTGQLTLNGSYNSAQSGSVFTNKASMYINLISFNGSTVTITNDTSGTMTFGPTVVQIQGSSVFTNYGTVNFQKGFEFDNGCTFTNNNDVQMDNSGSTLVNNGNFTNNGYIYVNGSYSSNSTSNSYNYCTLIATSGMTIQGNANNYGYMLVPTNGTAANGGSPLFQVNGGTFTNNGWVQGTNYTNSATVTGSGNFYFSGYTYSSSNVYGTSSSSKLNFYDASNSGFTSGQYFDNQVNNPAYYTNMTKTVISTKSINGRPSTCNALAADAGSNKECTAVGSGYAASTSSLLLNGSFTRAITNSVITSSPGTYNTGAATTYSFSGGNFKSQADYNGTSCAKAYSYGNAFALVTATPATPYTGSGNCNNFSQKYFPGDAAYGVSAADTMMAITANNLSGSEFLAYQQTVTGLTVNNYYTFYFYISNLREPSTSNSTDEPYIRVRVGGTDGMPDGTLGFGPYIFDETTTQNSATLNGWVRVAYTFKATSATTYLKITDGAYKSSNGDDWAITAMGLQLCANCTPTIASICNATPPNPSVQLYESSGLGVTWYWTTTSGGRFYTDATYSVSTDSTTSHLNAPYIKFYGDYTLQITTSTGCTGTGSLTVSSSCGSVLATSLLNFTVQKDGNSALLNWSTANEVNNDHFEVERSADGTNWVFIGRIQGHTNSSTVQNYSYIDALPLNGTNYYRLKQVDVNGGFNYSVTRLANFTGLTALRVYPSPSTDHIVISFIHDKNEAAGLLIIGEDGRVIMSKTQSLVNGNNTITINYTGNMADGLYLLKINAASKIYASKFIKISK